MLSDCDLVENFLLSHLESLRQGLEASRRARFHVNLLDTELAIVVDLFYLRPRELEREGKVT